MQVRNGEFGRQHPVARAGNRGSAATMPAPEPELGPAPALAPLHRRDWRGRSTSCPVRQKGLALAPLRALLLSPAAAAAPPLQSDGMINQKTDAGLWSHINLF